MAIQTRRGDYADYDASKMLPAEFATMLQNDPRAVDGKALHVAFGPGVDKTLMTFEDADSMISEAVNTAVEEATEDAEEFAQESEAWAVGTKDGTDVPSTDPQYHNNARYYAEQMGNIDLVATGDGTVTLTLSL